MPDEDSEQPYRVIPSKGRYQVVTSGDRCVMDCGDDASAQQYALMLNQAFKAGYRQAKKDGRQGG